MIICQKYVPINKGNCLGIVDIFVEGWGIEIKGLTLNQKDGKRWINFPCKSYQNQEGETKFAPYFKIPERDKYFQFCKAVLESIERDAVQRSEAH